MPFCLAAVFITAAPVCYNMVERTAGEGGQPDLAKETPEECAEACTMDPGCTAYTFVSRGNPDDRGCTLHTDMPSRVTNDDADLSVKIPCGTWHLVFCTVAVSSNTHFATFFVFFVLFSVSLFLLNHIRHV